MTGGAGALGFGDPSEAFSRAFPDLSDVSVSYCPYRVCPLGAHIDHQGGRVTGFALDKGALIAFSPSDGDEVSVASADFSGRHRFRLGEIPPKRGDWADYVRASAYALRKLYPIDIGVSALIVGQLPIGGLSSSAAVILAFMRALSLANGVSPTRDEYVSAARLAENEYVGVGVGLLDQTCEAHCERDRLLYLDARDRSMELIPKNPLAAPMRLAVAYGGLGRSLAVTAYNARADEARAAAYALMAHSGMEYGAFGGARLRDVPFEAYERFGPRLPDNWRKRAEHYYSEERRVREGVSAWREGDIARFGALVSESGSSSVLNYETGSPELIGLFDILRRADGVYGARFSGAGFGGCCMAVVDPAFEDAIAASVGAAYSKAFPKLAEAFSIHFCDSADGLFRREGI